jgi:membrane protein DedA with SNARE-associated domain
MSYVRTAIGVVVGIVIIHVIQFAAIEMMGTAVPVFLDILPSGGAFSAQSRVKSIRDIVVLWVPLTADIALIAVAVLFEYRKQRVSAQEQVGPLR